MKRIVMRFSKPLTERLLYQQMEVTQEDILKADVEGIKERIKKDLTRTLKSINAIRFLNPSLFTALKYRVDGLDYELEHLVDFRKIDDITYWFVYPMDMAALVQMKNIGLKLGLLKIKERDIELAKVINEQKLMEAFKKFSFVQMKLEPETYSITSEEFEAEPVQEAPGLVLSPKEPLEQSEPDKEEKTSKNAQDDA